jgi:hypothetical protein
MKWKKIILGVAIVFFVGSWIVTGLGLGFGVDKTTFLIMVTVAAVATETLFWAVAVVFGISVYESRKKIWHWVKSKFSKKPKSIK